MGRPDPKRGQPGNPGQFAKDTRGKTMLPQPSRLSRAYQNEGAPPNQVSEAVEGYRMMHTVARTSMAAYRATDETAGVLHEMWRQNRRQPDGSFEPRWKDDGAGGQVDIANTPYENLPDKWKAENRASADSAVQAMLADPDADMEILASDVHDQWLTRNAVVCAAGTKPPLRGVVRQ
jgi:hypothetical protein